MHCTFGYCAVLLQLNFEATQNQKVLLFDLVNTGYSQLSALVSKGEDSSYQPFVSQ